MQTHEGPNSVQSTLDDARHARERFWRLEAGSKKFCQLPKGRESG